MFDKTISRRLTWQDNGFWCRESRFKSLRESNAKLCGRCGETRPLHEFHKRGNGYQSWCKLCKKSDSHIRYYDNIEYEIDRRNRTKAERMAWYNSLKDYPCTDCRVRYPPYVMQWDHIQDKAYNISQMVFTRSKEAILNEIAKCELVCANCHCERTHSRR